MPAAEVNRFPPHLYGTNRTDYDYGDCALVCMSFYLGVGYDEVYRATAGVDKRNKGREGLWTRQMKQVAKLLGHRLVKKRGPIDWEEDYGILLLADHVVVLRNGLIFETCGDIWEAETYLKANPKHMPVEGLLVAAE